MIIYWNHGHIVYCSEDIDSEHGENDTIYEGFSIDDFDTRKIEQLDYYNSLRKIEIDRNILNEKEKQEVAPEQLLLENLFPNRSKDCNEELDCPSDEEYPSFLGYSVHIYEHSPRKYSKHKDLQYSGTMAKYNILPKSQIHTTSLIHSTHV